MAKKASRAGPSTASGDKQVHQYDKILRENMEATVPGLIKNLLGIYTLHTEELPDDIQYTKERHPDVLKIVTDDKGETFVLHIEFQATDEAVMPWRMAEYYIMLSRRYKLPIRQYVLYLGVEKPRMSDHIHSAQMHYRYHLITVSTIDYRLLLNADNPEQKMLAILGNFGNSNPNQTIENIVKEVIVASKGDFTKLRHLKQLRILSQLRNFTTQQILLMESVATFFKIEKDWFYQWGAIKGEKAKTLEIVKNLLLQTDFSIRRIATLANVSEYYVRKVKKSLHP